MGDVDAPGEPEQAAATGAGKCQHLAFAPDPAGRDRCTSCNRTRKQLESLKLGRAAKAKKSAEARAARSGVDRTKPGSSRASDRPGAPAVVETPHETERQAPAAPVAAPVVPLVPTEQAPTVATAPPTGEKLSLTSMLRKAAGL